MLSRIDAVWRTRGPVGFARFVGTRIFGCRRDAIFEASTGDFAAYIRWTGPGTLVFVTPTNAPALLTPDLAAQLSRGEGEAYVEGLRHEDMALLVIDDGGKIVHHSFVLFATRTKAVLGELPSMPLFANCATRPEARGQGIYPRVLRHGLALLRESGHERAVINCDPANASSIRGIEHAGFRLMRRTVTWILLSRLALQSVRDSMGRRFVRVFWT